MERNSRDNRPVTFYLKEVDGRYFYTFNTDDDNSWKETTKEIYEDLKNNG